MDIQARDKVNILLVDDQPSRLLSYESVLKELDQNLIFAHSGIEALECLMKGDFALVLLDVSMPGMDGFETAAMIHDHPRFERTPIIFVTGVHDSDLDRLKGYKLGAVDYVSIPVVPEILRSKVSVLVELHYQRQELQHLNQSLADANARLEAAHSTLQAEKTRELEVLNNDLRRANADLANANAALQAQIAERLRAEMALKEADRHKDEFIAILAHELRNPLAPIRSALEVMSKVSLDNERLIWSRNVIDRQVVHLTRLVGDLLDISRITRGAINLTVAPVRVGLVIESAVEAIRPVIAEHGHELLVDCDVESVAVEGDLTRLVQVLGNLLTNAAKYTNPGGRIELTGRQMGGEVEFRVKDNGVGIPSESAAKLFSLFSRLSGARDHVHDGLGVGLALARKLVEMHGGEIAVYSAGVDQGSEFTVRLPVSAGAAPTVKQPMQAYSTGTAVADSEPLQEAEERFRVLIADDNADALESLAMLLELSGHEVWKAANGEEAVGLATKHRPDIVLLDIGMPKLNGYEVAKCIRTQNWSSGATLIAVSGWGQSEDKRRSDEAGFDLHLVKPVDFDALAKIFAERAAEEREMRKAASQHSGSAG